VALAGPSEPPSRKRAIGPTCSSRADRPAGVRRLGAAGAGRSPGWGYDRDHDGIPNRYDRVYNPRWDRDGDGIPNRYDRVYNPRWDRDGDGVPNRYDRYDNRGHDRDRDGIPDRFDRRDDRRYPHGR
jgi:hypothetical protein